MNLQEQKKKSDQKQYKDNPAELVKKDERISHNCEMFFEYEENLDKTGFKIKETG